MRGPAERWDWLATTPGVAAILASAAWDTARAANALVPDDAGARGTPTIVAYLVTPCLLIAWVARDKLLDVQLSHRA